MREARGGACFFSEARGERGKFFCLSYSSENAPILILKNGAFHPELDSPAQEQKTAQPGPKNAMLEGLEVSGWAGPGHYELVHNVFRVGVMLYSSPRYLVTTEWHGTAHLGFSGASGQAIYSARTGLGWGRCAFFCSWAVPNLDGPGRATHTNDTNYYYEATLLSKALMVPCWQLLESFAV